MTAQDGSSPAAAGQSHSPDPGVCVRETGSLAAETRVSHADGSIWTAPRLHRTLLDTGLDEAVHQAIDALPEDLTHTALNDVGLTPLDGHLSVLAADAARAGPESDAADRFLAALRGLGQGRVGNLPTSTADVFSGTPVLLAVVEDVVPTVEVVLDESWADRRREYRSDTLQLLIDLAVGCRVEIVATPAARTCIWKQHRDDCPPSVTRPCNPRREGDVPDDALGASTLEEIVAEARTALDPDGAPAAICRYLQPLDHAPTYAEIETALCLDDYAESYVRVAAQRLAELSLVERVQRPDGRTVLRLRAAGEAYVDRLSVQSTLADSAAAEKTTKHPPKILPTCRVLRAGTGRGDRDRTAAADRGAPTEDTRDAGEPLAGEGDSVANSADAATDDYDHGLVDVRYLPYPEQAAVLGATEQGSVTLADTGIEGREDPRQPLVGYDDVEDQLVVSVRYTNPMQWVVSTARALTSLHVWNTALADNRLGTNLRGLDSMPGLNILQDARNLGWLTFEDADGERYRDRLTDAKEKLCELTTAYHRGEYADCNEFRGEITRFGHGLIGTMTHLLELAGVDVVLECRVPDAARHFGPEDSRRQSLCRTLATTASIQARYGHCVLRRQLYEQRQEKVERAIDPEVDPSDPFGTLPTAIVVAGDGAEDLQGDLRRWFDAPADLRENAPEIAADIPIRTDGSVAATREAAERMCRRNGLEPTDAAVALLHGLTRSPYAVSAALAALGDEPGHRDLALDEVRYALSHLDEGRLWRRDATPTQKTGLKVLLEADEPISQAELCRRGDFSPQSWRNNREVLVAADLVRETAAGWRLSLPFRDERYGDGDDVPDDDRDASADVVDGDQDDGDVSRPPWFVQEYCDRPGILVRDQRRPLDVLLELVEEWLPAEQYHRLGDPDHPMGRLIQGYTAADDCLTHTVEQVLDKLELGVVWPLVVASCGIRDEHNPGVDRSVMGPELTQQVIEPTSNA